MGRRNALYGLSFLAVISSLSPAACASGCAEPQQRVEAPQPEVIGRSADGKRLAYCALKGGKHLVVGDCREVPEYNMSLIMLLWPSRVQFSLA